MDRISFFLSSLLLLSFSFVFADEAASITKIYYSSDNSIERRTALKSIKDVAIPNGQATPVWIKDLLGDALNDKSPTVVAEAARQIGHLKGVEHTIQLINLFRDAHAKFGASGYTHKVQYAVLTALGKLGTKEAKALVVGLLKNDEGSAMGEYLLTAIRDFGDFSLYNEVRVYRSKMDKIAANATARNLDPILFSRNVKYSNYAQLIEQELAKGGK